MESHPIIKYVVIGIFILILGALGSAFSALIRGRGAGTAGVKALTIRVGLSIGLFVFLMVLYALGIIKPHGL